MNFVSFAQRFLVVSALLSTAACATPGEDESDDESAAEPSLGTSAQALSCQASVSAAAITKQIVSAGEPSTLTVELVTLSPKPFRLMATSLATPPGLLVQALGTTSCADAGGSYKCRHTAALRATTACAGTGSYTMGLLALADAGSMCPPVQSREVRFSLTTENFCAGTTVTAP